MWRYGSHGANAQASEILYVIEQRPCFIAQGRIEIRFDIYAELPKIAIFIVVVLKFSSPEFRQQYSEGEDDAGTLQRYPASSILGQRYPVALFECDSLASEANFAMPQSP
jgi:hypothetical protein